MKRQKLALDGGTPVRSDLLPIYRLQIHENEIAAVLSVLESGHISRGHLREDFEMCFCDYTGANYAIVVNSGTAALHLVLNALNLPADSEVILPSLSFVATAFAVEYCNFKPVFAEIDPYTLNISVDDIERRITEKTRAILAVDYAGLPADLNNLKSICKKYGLYLIEDAAHAIGACYNGCMIGNCSDLTAFSLFATKNMTAGEGGIVTTNDKDLADYVRASRAHGISILRNAPRASGFYDVKCLGYNYHLSDLNIALGIEQLKRLNDLNKLRRNNAAYLTHLLEDIEEIQTPLHSKDHVYHLYSVQLRKKELVPIRNKIIEALEAEGIQAGVYYLPIHLHTYFRKKYGFCHDSLPTTEAISNSLITLPFYPTLTHQDLEDIARALKKLIHHMKSS